MSEIKLLDDRLVSKIAAGEVVERPSSVVKELVENSLDAGARDVHVELVSGGKRRMIVKDDGRGMDADDALLAFDRHATSKILDFDDLERVGTLGFRGEALASIAAVSRVELRTARQAGDGHLVRIEGGHVRRAEPVSHPRGTHLEIASLFFNVPARRKFLKRPSTELRRCVEVMQGYALAHPEVRFTLVHEGRTLLETVPSGEVDDDAELAGPDPEALRERIAQVFGRELVEHLYEIPVDFVGEEEAVSGFVGDASTTRGRRLFLYVNRRLVRDRTLLARFYRSVRDVWRSEDYPALFLFLEVLPELVDVNVHPQKAEVRFRDLRFVDRVEEALRHTLDLARSQGEAPLRTPRSLPDLPAAWEGLGGRERSQTGVAGAGEVAERTPEYDAGWTPGPQDPNDPNESNVPPRRPWSGSPDGSPGGGVQLPAGSTIGSIARPTFEPIRRGDSPLAGRGKRLTPFRVVGQYKGSLILLEGHDGLYLVDQHAAHERLLYEQMRRDMASRSSASQRLLEPVMLELAPAEAMRLGELTDSLEASGFEVRAMSGTTVALTSIPEALSAEKAERILLALATAEDLGGEAADPDDEDSDGEGESRSSVQLVRRRLLEELAADMSCKAAIKIHRPMGREEMEALISDLFACEQPYACPHGRPTVLHMSDTEMERRFGRRG